MYELIGLAALFSAVALGVAVFIGLLSSPLVVRQFWTSLAIWCAQLLVALVAMFWPGFVPASVQHCSPNCDVGLLLASAFIFMLAATAIQLASLVLIIVLRRNERVWIVPVSAIGLLLVLGTIPFAIANEAMHFF